MAEAKAVAVPKITIASPSCCSTTKVVVVIAFAIALFSIISYFMELSSAEVSYGGGGFSFVLLVLACLCKPKDMATHKMIAGKTQIQKFTTIADDFIVLKSDLIEERLGEVTSRNLGLAVLFSRSENNSVSCGSIFNFKDRKNLSKELLIFCRERCHSLQTDIVAGRVIFGIIDFDQWKNQTGKKVELEHHPIGNEYSFVKVRDVPYDAALFAVGFTELDLSPVQSYANGAHLFHVCREFLMGQRAGRAQPAILFGSSVGSQ